jgi:hypothetical protein
MTRTLRDLNAGVGKKGDWEKTEENLKENFSESLAINFPNHSYKNRKFNYSD